MHEQLLQFAEQSGCTLLHSGKHTTRIHFADVDLGYVNPTVKRRHACYGYKFRFGTPNDGIPIGDLESRSLFRARYGELPGLDWHDGSGSNGSRTFLCIADINSAKLVLLKDIAELKEPVRDDAQHVPQDRGAAETPKPPVNVETPITGVVTSRIVPPEIDVTGSALANDVATILANNRIGATDKASLVIARVGQGAFRDGVLKRWDGRCSVTASSTLEAIRASHIKPWRESTDEERLDPNNGLPLVASLDALFDAGLISFDSSGTMIVSTRLNASEQRLFGVAGRSLRKMPSGVTAKYLEYHRKHVFRG